jgi:hypothetical protein
MTRTGRRLVAAALTTGVALAATACGGDDEPAASSETSASSEPDDPSSQSADEESTQADPSESATAGVAAANGIALEQTVAAINAPEGWTEGDGLVDYASAAEGAGTDLIYLIDNPSLASPDATIDDLWDQQVKLNKDDKDTTYERLDNVDLAGTPASFVHSHLKGSDNQGYEVTAVHSGRVITIQFQVSDKTLQKEPQLVESVLASFRWLD